MKEYVALTGGRYTYADDILNLQALALSMSTIFEGCSNFIMSGCEIDGTTISSGYVWIGDKIRYFEGANSVTFPYYIYEINSTESVVYANEANKIGRHNFSSASGSAVPETIDPLTNKRASFIEIREAYAPRLIDKFFGKYALLLDSPFSKQTVKKDLVVAGKLSSEKDITSKTAISVVNSANGHVLKNIVKANGSGSVGLYLNGLLINEIVINGNGSFSFLKQDIEIARIDENGFLCSTSRNTTAHIGSLSIYNNHILNTALDSDDGAVEINYLGYSNSTTRFRNFIVYDGKQRQILIVEGKSAKVGVFGILTVNGADAVAIIKNTSFPKTDKKLKGSIKWQDRDNADITSIGYIDDLTFDFTITNHIGNIIISSTGYIDIQGELKINGVYISTTYVKATDFTTELAKKVDSVKDKQLSDENFTTDLKEKLAAIASGSLDGGEDGFVSSGDVAEALKLKLTCTENLLDVLDKAAARENMSIYSRTECDGRYLRISNKLSELVSLSVDEINSLSPEEALALKAEKQAAVRLNIDAEKAGSADKRLAKLSNLSDLSNLEQARKNINVYSILEINELLEGKLGSDDSYDGAIFTDELRQKLDEIVKGNFAYIDNIGVSHVQSEGYVVTSQVMTELKKKANLLLDGYNATEKGTIATNLGIYTQAGANSRFAALENVFQDYITYLVQQGHSSSVAQSMLCEKLGVYSKLEITNNYIRKDKNLSDLSLPNADAKKLVCRTIGAAYASDYQAKLVDTGWLNMSNSGTATDTGRLFIRQIGNVVSIQGSVNTAKRDGSNWGGTVAIIPNQIQPPKYGLRVSFADYNDDHEHNRGTSFQISGNSRSIKIYESGYYNIETNIHFTYMV